MTTTNEFESAKKGHGIFFKNNEHHKAAMDEWRNCAPISPQRSIQH